MKGSRKIAPPIEFTAWLALGNDDWRPEYPINDRSVRTAIVTSLRREQRGLCVYCGQLLDMSMPGKSFHVEHFRPRNGQNAYPSLAVDYGNLFLSCGQENEDGQPSETCGKRKGDWFDESTHVAPHYPNCTKRFRFFLTGKIEPANKEDISAKNMIFKLALDHAELSKDRENMLLLLDGGELDLSDFWDAPTGFAESLAHIAYQHLGKILP